MKDKKPVIFVGVIILLIVSWTVIKNYVLKPSLLNEGELYTLATVYRINNENAKTRYAYYYFMNAGDSIKGAVEYNAKVGPVGTKYLIKYSKDHPKINEIYIDKPAPPNTATPTNAWDSAPNW